MNMTMTKPPYRAMRTFYRAGETIDECLATFAHWIDAERYAYEVSEKTGWSVWIQERG